MSSDYLVDSFEQTKELTKVREDICLPKKYKVILFNDDYTPMDFVVYILKRFFGMSEENATQTMLEVHFKGQSVCGIFSRDIAETKMALVNDYSRSEEYPLLCKMEPE